MFIYVFKSIHALEIGLKRVLYKNNCFSMPYYWASEARPLVASSTVEGLYVSVCLSVRRVKVFSMMIITFVTRDPYPLGTKL